MIHQVFISYSSKDKKFAEKIYSFLKGQGISCWISSKDIPAGADYQVCVVEAINQAQIVLLIFSANANSSNEIAKELSLASKKVLIPTRIEDVIPEGAFQYQLSNRQFIDLFEDFDNRLQELAHRIQHALGLPTVPLKPPATTMWKKITVGVAALVGVASLGAGGWLYSSGRIGGGLAASPSPLAGASPTAGSTAAVATPALATQQTSLGVSTQFTASPITPPAGTSAATPVVPEKTPAPVAVAPAPPLVVAVAAREVEISANVNAFAATLKDKKDNQRESALRAAKDSIPENLNPKEAELLLKNTGPYRANVIALIADKVAANQGGDEVANILGDTVENGREISIQSLSRAGKIKQGLTGSELNTILRNTGPYRSNVIALLAENLATNQDSAATALVLGDTDENSRLIALQNMIKAGKIKNGLSARETSTILKNMGPYRANAIAIIAENLSTGLDGESMATVLGDTTENARLTAIQTLLRAEKIKSGLHASEAVTLLKNTGPYRSNAVKLLSENLVSNLDGTAVALILGDLDGNSRLDALKGLVNASKLKQGLKPAEVQGIVKGMNAYAQDGTKALAALSAK